MSNEYIILPKDEEAIRLKALEYIETRGIKQTFLSKKVGLSDVSISLFLRSRRRLAKDKLDRINAVIQ